MPPNDLPIFQPLTGVYEPSGIQQLAGDATLLFYMTEEAQHGRDAFKEKRRPNFRQFPKRP